MNPHASDQNLRPSTVDRPFQPDGLLHGVVFGCPHPDDMMRWHRDASAAAPPARYPGRWLVIRRSRHVASPGSIAFPGGAREVGEPWLQALHREAAEELGATLGGIRCVWSIDFDDRPLRLRGYLAELVTPPAEIRPDPAEVAEAMWLTADQIHNHPDALRNTDRLVEALVTALNPSRARSTSSSGVSEDDSATD